MALFVNACFLVLFNLEMILFLEAHYDFGIENSNERNDATLVPLAKYSFVVLLNLTIRQAYCTGALISRTFVLTVAHCVSDETDTSVIVYREIFDDTKLEHVHKNMTNTTEQIIKGYEERKSVAIVQPWLFKTTGNTFDIALIQVQKPFENRNFVKATLITPFIQSNENVSCKAVGYNKGTAPYSISNKKFSMIVEKPVLVEKQCERKHLTYGKCTGISWIVQQDKQYIDNAFANTAALLLCSGNSTLKTTLNGLSVGKIHVPSSGTPTRTELPLVFTDICPYLSWIRSYVGHSIIRSPGHYGKGCFSSSSSMRTQAQSTMAWFVIIVCILLYL